jgi:signal transduction histidine kinase
VTGGEAPRPDDALIGLNRLATVARLLSGAAHEVNNALQIISGTIEVLRARSDTPPAVLDVLARLDTQHERAAAALGQVLAFARAARADGGPVNLREMAEESLRLRAFSIRRAGLTSRLDASPSALFVVTGDRADLQQALLNVVMNAEHALAGTAGEIVVRLSSEDGAVVVRVIDEGPGVSIEPPDHAFHPFVTTHDPFEWPGLGLWAAQRLVERHGGTLTLEAAARGAAFAMRLPGRPMPEPRRTA